MDNNLNVEGMNFENNEIAGEIMEVCENVEVSGGGKLVKILVGAGLTLGAALLLMKRKNIKNYFTIRNIRKLEKMGYVVIHESDVNVGEEESGDDEDVEEAENY